MSRILGPGSLSIGETASIRQIAGDVTKISISPSTDSEDDIPMLDGTNETGADTTSWEMSFTAMDKYTLDSLTVWAATNAGKEMPFVFTPSNESQLTVGGVVKVRPIALGGDVKKKNTNDATWPLVGDPTFAEA